MSLLFLFLCKLDDNLPTAMCVYIIIIIIIIIKASRQHEFPKFYFIIRSYRSSLLANSLDGIKCSHKPFECKVLLVSQHWCVDVLES